MVKPVSVCFRVDADERIGLGHLSRCRSLMLAFSSIANCAFTVLTHDEDMVKKVISDINVDVHRVGYPFTKKDFDIIMVDVPGISTEESEYFRDFKAVLACIDDEGPGLSVQKILIRPNLLDLPRPSTIAAGDYWARREAIILHPDFTAQAYRKRDRAAKVRELLVCFGGSDPGKLTLRVIPLLKKLDGGMRIHIVLGAAFSSVKEVMRTLKDAPRFVVSRNVLNMAGVLGKVDMALISGGTLLYEACALGIPSVVFSQNKPQETEALICQQEGAVVSLGVLEAVSDEKITGALLSLIKDVSLRSAMAVAGPRVVAPDGAMRIASRMLSYVNRESGV